MLRLSEQLDLNPAIDPEPTHAPVNSERRDKTAEYQLGNANLDAIALYGAALAPNHP